MNLFENLQLLKESSGGRNINISTDIFNIKAHSEEAGELLDTIDLAMLDIRDQIGGGFDIDDTGLDGNPKIEPNRNIIYKAQIFKFDAKNHKEIPLNRKQISTIEKAILDKIILPKEDEKYEYEVKVSIYDTQLSITLRREQKMNW